ncbi:MAG: hypothetical protein FJ403_14755 [Verrucomicrobia bacterium]|nr:hypothetical protein [Verrucomicrobiota bacterium]
MSDINLNALSRSPGIEKTSNPVAPHKNGSAKTASLGADSIQFSQLPDLSAIEEAVETEFAVLRSNLEEEAASPAYPPLEMIDRLSAMLAISFGPNGKNSLE